MEFYEKVIAALKNCTGNKPELMRQKAKEFMPEICKAYQQFPYEYSASTFPKLRNIAMANLMKFFDTSTRLNFDDFHALESLFTASGPTAEARLFALMLISVSTPDKDFEYQALKKILDLQLVESGAVGKLSLDELKGWALKFMTHSRGKQVLTEICELMQPAPQQVNVDKLDIKVQFFSSPDTTLWGFSGINTIFINVLALQKVHEFAMKKHDPKKDIQAWKDDGSFEEHIKMVVAIIGFHELTHIVIRKTKNNANYVHTSHAVSHKFGHYHSNNAGLIAVIRVLDLPPINWEFLATDSDCVHVLFKFVNTPNQTAPVLSIYNFSQLSTTNTFLVCDGQ
eukprot:Phypoly_transcript_09885.p1 GENE.Phypoly_transcript_09885~~Phypoly_transcript_09885.p1  ORF type:complete len:340 (-),score=44.34 Phypoly_transcript_09885:195-1214(-)